MANDEPEEKLAEGTLISHLLELRNRLIRAGIAWVIVFLPCAYYSNALFEMVARPIKAKLPPDSHLIATGVITPFITPFKLAMYVALFIAMPYVLYQVWAFVAPGLYRHEKRFALPLVVSSICLFYAGMAFAYFAVFPVVFGFMVTTTPKGILMMTDISQYLDFVMRLFLAFGVAFEAPIAVVLLATTGLVSVEKLASNRGYVLVAITVAAAALAPPDAISMIIMAVPMYLLYEAGLFFAKFAVKAKLRREAQDQETAKAQ
jgi:sec-independent protein translocase protein TatC